jgi:hypothetical protein
MDVWSDPPQRLLARRLLRGESARLFPDSCCAAQNFGGGGLRYGSTTEIGVLAV